MFSPLLPPLLVALLPIAAQAAIPSSPPTTAIALQPNLISFSIEFSYVPTFLGNNSSPNTLVLNAFEGIVNRTGSIGFRAGGDTADSAMYNSSVSTGVELDLSPSDGIWQTDFGEGYFESLRLLPNGQVDGFLYWTEISFDLNFGNDSYAIAQAEAQAAYSALGSLLTNFEIGNEPDLYNSNQRDLTAWTTNATEYTTEWNSWAANLTSELSLPNQFFQALASGVDPTSDGALTTAEVIAAGITESYIQTFSQHMYQYSTCDTTRDALATIPALISHQNITSYIDIFKPQVSAAVSAGKSLVVGEFNSVSCSGKQNVSNTFAQALWLVDTICYAAASNISRMYSHQGAVLVLQSSSQTNTPGYSWYNFVYPAYSDKNGDARTTPSYIAYLALGEFVSHSTGSISSVDLGAGDELAGYAVWENNTLARTLMLNLGSSDVSVALPTGAKELKRMVSTTGVEEEDPTYVTWAGQNYVQAVPYGTLNVETISSDSNITVAAYSAVLVFVGNTSTSTTTSTTTSPSAGASSTSRPSGAVTTISKSSGMVVIFAVAFGVVAVAW